MIDKSRSNSEQPRRSPGSMFGSNTRARKSRLDAFLRLAERLRTARISGGRHSSHLSVHATAEIALTMSASAAASGSRCGMASNSRKSSRAASRRSRAERIVVSRLVSYSVGLAPLSGSLSGVPPPEEALSGRTRSLRCDTASRTLEVDEASGGHYRPPPPKTSPGCSIPLPSQRTEYQASSTRAPTLESPG